MARNRVSTVGVILFAIVFVAFCVIPLVSAACPHNCSGHGICRNNRCECDDAHTGSDCSISVRELDSGNTIHDSLNTFTWKYYMIRVPAGVSGLNITVDQTNTFGDVDVYVQRGTFPTFSDNMAKDISVDPHIVISISPANPGNYYIGTYAYFHVEYQLVAELLLDCSVDCGEHGICSSNRCFCNEGWSGETCDIFDLAVPPVGSVEGSVPSSEWRYYHTDVRNNQEIFLTVDQHPTGGESCDVDVYLRLDDYPSMFEFDAANATINPQTTIHITDPTPGTWYIGIYGYRGCAFTLRLSIADRVGCISECSRHGNCVGNTCSCNSGYNGAFCQDKTAPLSLNSVEHGYVASTTWNYYFFSQLTTNNILISVHQESATADCDLFIKSGSKPTNFDFDASNLSFYQDFNITVVNPGSETWWVGVYGWTDCAYQLTMTLPVTCGCTTSHGHCEPNSPLCICDQGWSGVGCDQQTQRLQNGEVYSDHVSLNQWAYYTITANSSAMLISMKEKNTSGRLWLFASQGGFPALDTYEVSDMMTNSDFHEVHFVFERQSLRSFFIGVYGSPFLPSNEEIEFSITAWSPPF